ncbi:MAG: GNAT family N-acetyltransferase [Actinomycetota bacterium]|nr:GNAT family N-acetyltransferase [Actinomycetota bacterium]
MDIDVRPMDPDRLSDYRVALSTAFGEDELNEAWTPVWENVFDRGRLLAAYDEDLIVGTAGNHSFTMTVPGGELPAAGLTIVGVIPTHRRRGVGRALMRAQIEDARRHDESISILWASEEVIYQRFGYGLGSAQMNIEIERAHTAFQDREPPGGRVRLLPLEEALKVLPDVYDRVRVTVPGMLARDADWWRFHCLFDPKEDRKGGKLMAAAWEEEGRAEAYALYRYNEKWDEREGLPRNEVWVMESVATTPRAVHAIWDYLFGIDLAQKVMGYFLPVDHPLPSMLLEPRRLRMHVSDAIWLRLVDIQTALVNRAYADAGDLTFTLADDFCDWNSGTWRLTVRPGGHSIDRANDAAAELALSANDLGATYLGALTFSELARAGRVKQLKPEAVDKADALFRTDRKPWCPEIF